MDNLWTRRTVRYVPHHTRAVPTPLLPTANPPPPPRSNTKLSLSTNNPPNGAGDGSNRSTSFAKRSGSDLATARSNSATTPGGGSGVSASPGAAAFGLGSGAFASFSVGSKTPKSPGNPFEMAMGQVGAKAPGAAVDKFPGRDAAGRPAGKAPSPAAGADKRGEVAAGPVSHPLMNKWVFWWRPPISKSQGFVDYEKTLRPMCHCDTVEDFFAVYTHLKNPSKLPTMSEYHFFKYGIRPIWEDDVNKKGGKWVVRLKKGVVDRYWEDLVLALIGEQFGDAGEEVCGAVANVRNGEDVLSIWTRNDGGRVIKIRYVPMVSPP